jgi:hypothetical protein
MIGWAEFKVSADQRPTHNTSRLPGPPRPPPPRRPPAGAFVAGACVGAPGMRSVQIKTIRLFFVSSDEVLQPALVSTVCSSAKLVGLFS